MEADKYYTIKENSEGIYKEKGSRFLSFAFPVNTEDEAKQHINDLKKKYYDASHCTYSYKIGIENQIFRMNDDKEPSGTAGKPIYGQIIALHLTNILIVVVRYFGGTKLGTGGLTKAYREAAKNALHNKNIILKTIECYYEIVINYEDLDKTLKIIRENKSKIHSKKIHPFCQIIFSVDKQYAEILIKQLLKNNRLKINYLYDK